MKTQGCHCWVDLSSLYMDKCLEHSRLPLEYKLIIKRMTGTGFVFSIKQSLATMHKKSLEQEPKIPLWLSSPLGRSIILALVLQPSEYLFLCQVEQLQQKILYPHPPSRTHSLWLQVKDVGWGKGGNLNIGYLQCSGFLLWTLSYSICRE